MARKSAHDLTNIFRWYVILQKIIINHILQPYNIANIDQTDFRISILKPQKNIIRNKNKIIWIQCSDDREFIIIIKYIVADDTALFSQIILSEKYILKKYIVAKLHDDI
jgi:hypothetical protein